MVTRGKPIKASIADMTLEKQIGKTNFRHDISNNETYCLQRAYPSRLCRKGLQTIQLKQNSTVFYWKWKTCKQTTEGVILKRPPVRGLKTKFYNSQLKMNEDKKKTPLKCVSKGPQGRAHETNLSDFQLRMQSNVNNS